MLKKKLKFIIPFLVLFLALALPIVNATEETSNDIMPISAEQEETADDTQNSDEQEATLSQEESIKSGDEYLAGSNITIDYMIDGNLFVFADNVTISSNVGGDAFIVAKSVEVTSSGYIYGNLFVVSPNLDIAGRVYDIYALSETTNITGAIYRDIKISSNNITLTGAVGRNAYIDSSNIIFEEAQNTSSAESTTLSTKGMIYGDLNYTSKSEITIPEGSVTGSVNFTQEVDSVSNSIENYLYSLGRILVLVIVIWLLCLWLAPKFLENMPILLTKKLPHVIGLGILTPIVLLVASILLLFINITSSIALLLFVMLFVLFAISTSLFIITVNNFICQKLKIQKNIGIFGMLIVTTIVLWGIGLIPYVGTIIGFIGIILGFGILTSHLVLKKETITQEI